MQLLHVSGGGGLLVVAPQLWNSVPVIVQLSARHLFKLYLFMKAFGIYFSVDFFGIIPYISDFSF